MSDQLIALQVFEEIWNSVKWQPNRQAGKGKVTNTGLALPKRESKSGKGKRNGKDGTLVHKQQED